MLTLAAFCDTTGQLQDCLRSGTGCTGIYSVIPGGGSDQIDFFIAQTTPYYGFFHMYDGYFHDTQILQLLVQEIVWEDSSFIQVLLNKYPVQVTSTGH